MSTTIPQQKPDADVQATPPDPEAERLRIEKAVRALDALDNMGSEEEQQETYKALTAALQETQRVNRPWLFEQ